LLAALFGIPTLLAAVVGLFSVASSDRLLVAGVAGLMCAVAAGMIFVAVGQLRSQARNDSGRPDDQTIDTWLREEVLVLVDRSLQRLNVDSSQLVREPLIVVGPSLKWHVNGIRELNWLRGGDGKLRFRFNDVAILHLMEHKLSSYQCTYDFVGGTPVEERDDEYYYRDIVAVSTRDEPAKNITHVQLGGQSVTSVLFFRVSVASGEAISVAINSPDFKRLTGGEVMESGANAAIKAMRAVLADRKLG
jgi:hypothetical protein